MAANKKSGHDRKRWRVTFKLPSIKHQHTQRFMELDTDEYSFTVMGYATGVAVQRAWAKLREVPELKGAIIRDCFITVRCLGYYTKAEEALLNTGANLPPEETEAVADINICPSCKNDITQYPKDSLAYTKHMVGECCIGMGEEDDNETSSN